MLSVDELKTISADKVVDARGTSCPGPLLAAKRAIAEVKREGIMEVLSSDEGTKRDIPKWSAKMGHDYLGCLEESGYFRIFLKRMK
jgi:tRNA 2-thiouridine synthesizing protein A